MSIKNDDHINYVYKECLNPTCHDYKRSVIHRIDPPVNSSIDPKVTCLGCSNKQQPIRHFRHNII